MIDTCSVPIEFSPNFTYLICCKVLLSTSEGELKTNIQKLEYRPEHLMMMQKDLVENPMEVAPPGYNTGDFIKKWGNRGKSYVIRLKKQIAGFIIVFPDPGKISFLGNITIALEFQDHGLGTVLIHFVEKKFPLCNHWKIETPAYATRNHHFYQKNGYRLVNFEIQREPGEKESKFAIFEKIKH